MSLVYYELDEQRTKEDAKDVAVCRVEKLCPFPYDCPTRAQKISNKRPAIWGQLFSYWCQSRLTIWSAYFCLLVGRIGKHLDFPSIQFFRSYQTRPD
ncbi:hypothetical protein JHK85_030174 [Glycine max]|nr:hypothetical protein JHK85_030174 [Glycine max]